MSKEFKNVMNQTIFYQIDKINNQLKDRIFKLEFEVKTISQFFVILDIAGVEVAIWYSDQQSDNEMVILDFFNHRAHTFPVALTTTESIQFRAMMTMYCRGCEHGKIVKYY